MSMTSRSSVLALCTVQTSITPCSAASASGCATVSRAGGLIQFSGLYEPPSECTSTLPSALTSSSRVASGRWAVRRPA